MSTLVASVSIYNYSCTEKAAVLKTETLQVNLLLWLTNPLIIILIRKKGSQSAHTCISEEHGHT